MDALAEFCDRARLLVEHHVSDEVSVPAFLGAAVAMLLIGLGVSVLGAKLARGSVVLWFAFLGGGVGSYVGRLADVPVVITAILGACMLGVVGFALHRLWVGIGAALAMVCVLNATYGAHTLGPQWQDYAHENGTMPAIVAPEPTTFTVPDPSAQAAALNPELTQWIGGFWDYAYTHDRVGTRKIALMSACAGLFGLLLGLFAPRLTLVTTSSLFGTALFSFGALSLAYAWRPEFYRAGVDHPQAVGVACGTFLLGSLILQTLLTRPHKARPDANGKS